MENEKWYKGSIVSLLLKAGVHYVILQKIGHHSPYFRHRKVNHETAVPVDLDNSNVESLESLLCDKIAVQIRS